MVLVVGTWSAESCNQNVAQAASEPRSTLEVVPNCSFRRGMTRTRVQILWLMESPNPTAKVSIAQNNPLQQRFSGEDPLHMAFLHLHLATSCYIWLLDSVTTCAYWNPPSSPHSRWPPNDSPAKWPAPTHDHVMSQNGSANSQAMTKSTNTKCCGAAYASLSSDYVRGILWQIWSATCACSINRYIMDPVCKEAYSWVISFCNM